MREKNNKKHISISSSQSDIGDALFSVPVITNRNLYYLIKTNFRILCVTWSHDLPVISPKSSLARILENLLFSKKRLYSSPLQSWIYIVKFNFIRLATRGENIDVHVLYLFHLVKSMKNFCLINYLIYLQVCSIS